MIVTHRLRRCKKKGQRQATSPVRVSGTPVRPAHQRVHAGTETLEGDGLAADAHSLSLAVVRESIARWWRRTSEELNAQGGVLGRQIEAVVEDGASDWPTFAKKAEKLITQDQGARCSAVGPPPAKRRSSRSSRLRMQRTAMLGDARCPAP
jgi:urea transport system substrate-binding protein